MKNILVLCHNVEPSMRKLLAVGAVALTLSLSSCAGSNMNKGGQGGVGGAAAGALIGQAIGHNTQATLLGAAIGGVLGYVIGNEMDKADQQRLNTVYERGPSGQATAWVNPDSGNQYRVIPQPSYTNESTRKICREATVEAVVDGRKEIAHTTACRDAYGKWHLQN
ncbi:related to 17 kDa surface antigen [Desulfotalea psychrophila LSv54]|uniref:Related to 17 kDa surface antigen n=2 Tax=Desulfotalea psychrophila TaxID=84980 RepID=Q6AS24_DESPS|nr:related to 17 kDa surface antigen [Desulfotalea psychrophila LSv54]